MIPQSVHSLGTVLGVQCGCIQVSSKAEQIYKVSVLKEKHVPNSAHAGDSC